MRYILVATAALLIASPAAFAAPAATGAGLQAAAVAMAGPQQVAKKMTKKKVRKPKIEYLRSAS